jgi:hypothetical protein
VEATALLRWGTNRPLHLSEIRYGGTVLTLSRARANFSEMQRAGTAAGMHMYYMADAHGRGRVHTCIRSRVFFLSQILWRVNTNKTYKFPSLPRVHHPIIRDST